MIGRLFDNVIDDIFKHLYTHTHVYTYCIWWHIVTSDNIYFMGKMHISENLTKESKNKIKRQFDEFFSIIFMILEKKSKPF